MLQGLANTSFLGRLANKRLHEHAASHPRGKGKVECIVYKYHCTVHRGNYTEAMGKVHWCLPEWSRDGEETSGTSLDSAETAPVCYLHHDQTSSEIALHLVRAAQGLEQP